MCRCAGGLRECASTPAASLEVPVPDLTEERFFCIFVTRPANHPRRPCCGTVQVPSGASARFSLQRNGVPGLRCGWAERSATGAPSVASRSTRFWIRFRDYR